MEEQGNIGLIRNTSEVETEVEGSLGRALDLSPPQILISKEQSRSTRLSYPLEFLWGTHTRCQECASILETVGSYY